ncbi:uncharacterized protein LOC143552029 [Bidens hawaiensis]|uniref:uncharacterized protein LOC143552029 n=1 Tax=Bidens hawaiensis TaxID=980011 RepID=UPI00404A634C
MAKSMRCKREKRLRAIKREMVAPLYEKKEEAKLAALEAALNAPKLPVRARRDESTSMDATADMDVEMDEGNQTAKSLKPIGRKLKKKLKLSKKKYRAKGKIRKKNV